VAHLLEFPVDSGQMSFPTTHWTQLAQASLNGDSLGRDALEEIYRDYWPPVRAAILRRWPWTEDADDLTQDFFLHLMEQGTLRRASRLRGRFRSYLLGALKFFLSHKLEAASAAKRGGGQKAVELQDWMVPSEDADPEFDRAWAIEILVRAMSRLEGESGFASFATLRGFLPGAADTPTYEEAAKASGRPVGTVKSDVNRLRKRLREIIRLEVACTVSAPHEIEDEVAYLHQILRR
jgi:DNA-directed RNA polymerase specialized sigma24 family protein